METLKELRIEVLYFIKNVQRFENLWIILCAYIFRVCICIKKNTIQYLSENYLTHRTVKYNTMEFRFWTYFKSGHTLNARTFKITMVFDIDRFHQCRSGPFSYPVIAQQTWLFVQYRGPIDKWNNVNLHHLWG